MPYSIEELRKLYLPPEPAPVRRAPPPSTGDRPGDEFNAAHDAGEVLTWLGFTYAKSDSRGDHWTRPNKATKKGTSATVYKDGGVSIWSSTCLGMWPAVQLGTEHRSYDPFGLLVATRYNGDFEAAARDLAAKGYGRSDVPLGAGDLVDEIGVYLTEEREGPTQGRGEQVKAPAGAQPTLPDEFWEARPVFTQISDAARARLIAPDAVMGAVLARVCLFADYRYVLPPVVGRLGSLNIDVALVGPSGVGKGAALDESAALLGQPALAGDYHIDEIAAGSGEGMVHAFFDSVEEEDKKVKRQTKHGLLVRIDEGEMLGGVHPRV